jgi:hypothetical protein
MLLLLTNKKKPADRLLLDSLHRLSRITQLLRMQVANQRTMKSPVNIPAQNAADSVKAAPAAKPGAAEIDAAAKLVQSELTLLKEASETTALRLQELTGKRSNMTFASNNLLKQITETMEEVIKNLK